VCHGLIGAPGHQAILDTTVDITEPLLLHTINVGNLRVERKIAWRPELRFWYHKFRTPSLRCMTTRQCRFSSYTLRVVSCQLRVHYEIMPADSSDPSKLYKPRRENPLPACTRRESAWLAPRVPTPLLRRILVSDLGGRRELATSLRLERRIRSEHTDTGANQAATQGEARGCGRWIRERIDRDCSFLEPQPLAPHDAEGRHAGATEAEPSGRRWWAPRRGETAGLPTMCPTQP
jgi:hypothetical protein